ncbi:MAG TPA: prepilin-type N-terminal cleavage/methylation domain-containing protein [Candidatus Acidoferrales bacterium]|nr:prepilin-type N-terminal cleavage/methylation domain-containing protein [Candidatus Acidoferrales bacterium]
MTRKRTMRKGSQGGFTLVEAAVAIVVLTIGVTAVVALFAQGFGLMGTSQQDLIARLKAQEAVESVFAGRDDQSLAWAQILNVKGASGSDGGIFLDGPQPINDPGADGLVNTADDGALEYIVLPGPDGQYGTADDVKVPLARFQREIKIRPIAGNANLRSLTVIITDTATGVVVYQIQTYISSFV